ncbi:MAG: hypothetical protein HY314_04900 [Acidobacteria bacterium]|nr:hypothetical protein [Acidobacteriota bacterium]
MRTNRPSYTTDELMVVAMSRQVQNGDVVGLGLATPMATIAAFLARQTHAPNATIILSGAVQPKTHNVALSMVNPVMLASISCGFLPHTVTMDMAERGVYSLQFLRPAQVDAEGNMNTSLIGSQQRPKLRLPGGLATGDVTLFMRRIVLYQPNHDLRNFPVQVDYKTGIGHPEQGRWRRRMKISGGGPTKIITDLCTLAFDTEADCFAVESLHPGISPSTVKERTGFELAWPTHASETEPPNERQLTWLRNTIDPYAVRRLEFKEHRQEVLKRLDDLQRRNNHGQSEK